MYYRSHTYFSTRYGTLSPEELVKSAADSGVEVLALTDTSCSGLYRFLRACKKHGLKPIAGMDFRRNSAHCFTGIARSEQGYHNLCEYHTGLSFHAQPCPIQAPGLEEVIFIYDKPPGRPLRPDEFVAVSPVTRSRDKLYAGVPTQKLIAMPFFTFRDESGYQLHRLLRCIDLNIVGGKLSPADQADKQNRLLPTEQWRQFSQRFPEIIRNTERLLEQCDMELSVGSHNNRQSFTGSRSDDRELLFKLCREGLKLRYSAGHKRAEERLEKELKVIDKLGFSTYFLITWDIVRYGKSSGFYHVGRGSGANSIAAYCLYITDVDPLELDLYFERFINPHRSSPPDFDIDFSWDERDQVTDYVFKRYGHRHTALLATYNTFGFRSVVRELGKVFGLPPADIDLIAEQPQATDRHHDYGRYILKYARMMDGMPNYLSIHAGGILITERPVFCHSALKMMPKGFPIVHFDMHDAEDMGFHKYDVLSQRGLGHIKDAVDIIQRNRKTRVDVRDVEHIKTDSGVHQQLRSGSCLGCFYIESPAMRGLLKKLRCDNYVHLVAASSIIRPGVAKSGMMREYIKRFHKPDEVKYLHPVFEEQLSETFGIMVYQEDVMKIVHHFAGLDLDESDVLRRIMTGKKKSGDTFDRLKAKYFRNCRKRGYSEELTQEVWRMIESFSGYSFCKAHSASFAVESFQSLYLKAYYPLEFAVAVINNFGGFYSTEFYVHEARISGARIEAPCVNHSHYLTSIRDKTIHLGFIHLKNLERDLARQIVRERRQNGPYSSLENFMLRLNPPKEQVQILIRIGAFRFTSTGKYELMWERCGWNHRLLRDPGQQLLFPVYEFDQSQLPCLTESRLEQAYDELELLGFPLCSPFELIENPPSNCIGAEKLGDKTGKNVRMCGYLVTYKPVRTTNKKRMAFVTWLDRNGHFFDSVHFPAIWEKYPLRGKGCYLLKGKVTDDFGLPSLELSYLEKLPYFPDPRYR
ncbi:MAG: DNA polymerase III subunit alpha [Saprospirales bacterium]|nr:MAG: DNA polymerase III subunit alpha [Saprospirales bacterium]